MFEADKPTAAAADLLKADAEAQPSAADAEALPGSDLTEAQRNFALAMLVSGNRSASYRQAYPRCSTDSAAKTEGARLARDPRVLRFQAAVSAKVIDLAAVSVGQIKEHAARIAFADVTQAFIAGTTQMKNPDEFPADLKLVVQAISVQEGEKGVKYSVKIPDKNQALRLLAELGGHLGQQKGNEGTSHFHFHVPGMKKIGKPTANERQLPSSVPQLVGSGVAE